MAKGHKDKVAVITGAANGIGQAFAQRLAARRRRHRRRRPRRRRRHREARSSRRPQGVCVECDVSSPEVGRRHGGKGAQRFGHVDIVVNCAGIFPLKEFEEMTFADWRRVLSINLDGTFLVTSRPSCPA